MLTGLVLACDYKRGQELFSDRNFDENEDFFQTIFEIGRRYRDLLAMFDKLFLTIDWIDTKL